MHRKILRLKCQSASTSWILPCSILRNSNGIKYSLYFPTSVKVPRLLRKVFLLKTYMTRRAFLQHLWSYLRTTIGFRINRRMKSWYRNSCRWKQQIQMKIQNQLSNLIKSKFRKTSKTFPMPWFSPPRLSIIVIPSKYLQIPKLWIKKVTVFCHYLLHLVHQSKKSTLRATLQHFSHRNRPG